jgi:transcriptional regulator with XRE-family HTH domain
VKKTLGQILKARREALFLSQRELARRLGIRASHVGYLETGRRRPSLSLLNRLGDLPGVETEPLFLLAYPEAKALLTRYALAHTPSRDHSWKTFSRDKGLLMRNRVTKRELRVLSQVNALGKISSPHHYLFILSAIRTAVDEA